ncbi:MULTISPECIES: hypothetical protein [Lactococcus]|uniref:FeoB-associated Cys-rich membrane protein n=2 Tax=Lactococcus TaxID=1357 RepID=A0A387BKK7_9LACT|nr:MULTISPECIES: hypothetical protein [Lactococcus]AYG01546.1 hypothetical protein D7I46_11010 [Lactococcus allomyrinae]MCL2112375.1 hypothetical protein [Streptococcaceae bacterium]QDK70446.1 hypothetical protein FLP15_03730 [Lactococcus protaetiae]
MNLASFIILAIILIITAFAIFKTIRSKGACEDCNVNSCPVKGVSVLPTDLHEAKEHTHDCCK